VDFRFTEEEEAFRAEVVQFVKENLPQTSRMPVIWAAEDTYSSDELWSLSKVMARKLAQRGWLNRSWPKEYGGKEASALSEFILIEELAYNGAPGKDPVGLGMLAPALIRYGSEAQKREHLVAMAQGEKFWCEGLSEPNSGSDLASLTTRAVEQGDHFLINGQKVWTTGAHRADWCFLLARTDTEVPKHRGLSLILADMQSPGISANPLLGISGGWSLNEVFFNDVKVPRDNLVGEKNQGWFLANTILTSERSLLIELVAITRRLVDMLAEYLRSEGDRLGESTRQRLRHELAEVSVEAEVARWLTYRLALLQDRGEESHSEAGMSKLFSSEVLQHVANVGMEVLGLFGLLKEESRWAALKGVVSHWYLSSMGTTLFGGTSEIQRNIIALRGLGLPRE
jgi:alkylation response protein AidB-like acyl-CoA dehydrogenase